MNYLLTILTNGRKDCFERTVEALAKFISPSPSRIYVYDDGGKTTKAFVDDVLWKHFGLEDDDFTYDWTNISVGMCKSYSFCWETAAATEDLDWVFHIEDDQLLLRPVELGELALTLDHHDHLAQMALVRAPWGKEIPHGGYIPMDATRYGRVGGFTYEWIETTKNWATSPALAKTQVFRDYDLPDGQHCEGMIAPTLLQINPETRFGLWGWGECWYAHIGVERAAGAFGY